MIKISGYKVKKPISLRGLAKTKLASDKLNFEIEKSRKTLFSREEA
jgi:hypothetical protein